MPKRRPPSYSKTAGNPGPRPASGTPIGFIPPGASSASRPNPNNNPQANRNFRPRVPMFSDSVGVNVRIPPRLCNVQASLVDAVNDFHYAMVNDMERNDFYYNLLSKYVTPESGVLEIGAGSGIISMMAAKLGAKWVVAVEGSSDMAALAQRNIKVNGLDDRVTVLNMLSTELELTDLPAKPDILVSEILGTLLLGESALDYVADMRERILKPETKIIPEHGIQYAVPIECTPLTRFTSVPTYRDLNLSNLMSIQDTINVVFTKQYGFRLSDVSFTRLCDPIPILSVDFAKSTRRSFEKKFDVQLTAKASGVAHAWMYFWVVTDDGHTMSTAPEDTKNNFPRDAHWGQGLQLIDEGSNPNSPSPLNMEEGKTYTFNCTLSEDRVVINLSYAPK